MGNVHYFFLRFSVKMTKTHPGGKQMDIKPGKYRHLKGKEYEVIGIAAHSETMEPMVVYRALYGDGGLWVRPAAMWNEQISREDYSGPRFIPLEN